MEIFITAIITSLVWALVWAGATINRLASHDCDDYGTD
jgi:hypothetical protein